MRILKFEIPLPKPAGEQIVEFTATVPGVLQQVLSAHVKSNGEGNVYVSTRSSENRESRVCFLLISTGTEYDIPMGRCQEDLKFVATLSFLGGQAVYHLFHW